MASLRVPAALATCTTALPSQQSEFPEHPRIVTRPLQRANLLQLAPLICSPALAPDGSRHLIVAVSGGREWFAIEIPLVATAVVISFALGLVAGVALTRRSAKDTTDHED